MEEQVMSEIKYITIGEFAKRIGVTAQTLRNWEKEKYLIPSYVTKGKTRYYSEELYEKFVADDLINKRDRDREKEKEPNNTVSIIGYVCSEGKNNTEREKLLLNYMTSNGYRFELIKDNSQEKISYETIQLITKLLSDSVTKLVVLEKSDFSKIDIKLIEHICRDQNIILEEINTKISATQELTKEDVISLLHIMENELSTETQQKLENIVVSLKKEIT